MNDLDKLAVKYGADKWGKHHYTPVYYEMFKDRRDSVKKVVEIGTGEGASIAMWNDFFPNAQIYGADIDPKRVTLPMTYPRITITRCDQTSDDDLIDLLNSTDSDIDLFVDDGSHKPEDQVFTCEQIVPSLDAGATYVIEDVADETIFEKIKSRFSYYNCQMVKLGKRYDDRLIIIYKNG